MNAESLIASVVGGILGASGGLAAYLGTRRTTGTQKEIADATGVREDTRQFIDDLQADNKDLRARIERLEGRYDEVLELNRRERARSGELEARVRELERHNQEGERALARSNEANAVLTSRVGELERRLRAAGLAL